MFPSTISSWALLVAKALESYGCDCDAVFKRAGLDPKKLRDPNARYPASGMLKLWRLAVETTDDPCFGLSVARFWHPTSLHALGYSWMASGTLKEALERTVRYFQVLTTAGRVRLEEEPEAYLLTLEPRNSLALPADEAIDAAMATLVFMCRTSYGEQFRPLRVAMRRTLPLCGGKFAAFFQAPIDYASANNGLYLGKHELNVRLPTANAELARANDRIVMSYLARMNDGNVSMQVKTQIVDQLPSGGLNERTIAGALNLSLRTLQRKLNELGTSYKALLDEARRDLASGYIQDPSYSISEITYLLGFSEPSNFSRAFKRWYGESPSQYRVTLGLDA